uniref:Uncharacterized protein n=1 Tax=Setaria italica TaxID=4555 RepID=K3YBK2_SETIT
MHMSKHQKQLEEGQGHRKSTELLVNKTRTMHKKNVQELLVRGTISEWLILDLEKNS